MKYFILLVLLMFSLTMYAQKDNNKLIYNSFAISPIEIYGDKNTAGGSISSDLSFRAKKNIYSISLSLSEELSIWGRGNRYFQLNTLFGREHKIASWFYIDTHGGIGLFRIKNDDFSVTTLGVPIQLKLRFKTGSRFSIGLRSQVNFNSQRTIYTIGLQLQWNSKKQAQYKF